MKKVFMLLFLTVLLSTALFAQIDRYLEGDFIGFGWDPSGMFSIGIPDPSAPDGVVRLLDGNYLYGGGTSNVNFYISGEVWTNDASAAADPEVDVRDLNPHRIGTEVTPFGVLTEWVIGSVYISQFLRLVEEPSESTGTVVIEYIITNESDSPIDAGVLVILDTQAGLLGGATTCLPHIIFSSGDVYGDSAAYYRDEDMPEYLTIRGRGADSIYSATCNLSYGPFGKPKWISVQDARDALTTEWEPPYYHRPLPECNAVLLCWDYDTLDRLMPEESRIVQLTYGTAAGAAIEGQIGVRYFAPKRLHLYNCDYTPLVFNFNYTAINRTLFRMRDLSATVSLPAGMEIVEGEETRHIATSLPAGGRRSGSWRLRVTDRLPDDNYYSYFITYTAEVESLYIDPDIPGDTVTVFVPTTTIVRDSIFVPGSDFTPPEFDLVQPFYDARTSLPDLEVLVYVDDEDAGVDIRTVDGMIMRPGAPIDMIPGSTLFLRGEDSDTLVMISPDPYENGDMIFILINSMRDMHGCLNDYDTIVSYFIVDMTGPVLGDYWPETDDVIEDSLLVVEIKSHDILSVVDPYSAVIRIQDDYRTTEYTGLDHPDAVDYSLEPDSLFRFSIEDAGSHYPDGIVTFTLLEIADVIHYGPANLAPACPLEWSFHVNAHGPRTRADEPLNEWYSSNPRQPVRFYLYDGNGIIPSSVVYTIGGDELGWDDLAHFEDSLHTYTPTSPWESGFEVVVEFLAAEDSFFTPICPSSELTYSFTIDLDGPELVSANPPNGSPVPSRRFTVTIEVEDELAGLCYHTASVTVNGTYEFDIDHEALFWIDGTNRLRYDNELTDFRPAIGEEFEICFTVTDSVHLGDFNSSTFCLDYTYMADGPEIEFVNTTGYLCDPMEPIQIIIRDRYAISIPTIMVTINNLDTMSVSGTILRFADSILTYTPASPYIVCDSMVFCLNAVANIHSHWATDVPVCYTYVLSTDSPAAELESPYIATMGDTIASWFVDGCVGIIEESIIIDIDGDEYHGDDDCIYVIGGSRIVFDASTIPFSPDSSIWYDVSLSFETICGDFVSVADSVVWSILETPANMLPTAVVLHQNIPNPFNAATLIRFELPKAMHATLTIHDIEGREVARLVDGMMPVGLNEVRWDGTNGAGRVLSSGYFIYRIVTEDQQEAKGMFLLK